MTLGLRIDECATLNYEDIVFGETSGSVTIRAGKGNKTRSVPLNGSARKALAEYVASTLSIDLPYNRLQRLGAGVD
jgi:site-specific recombinase XerD